NNKEIIVPDLFQEFISDSSSFKIYNSKDIQNLNKISKDIKNGKFIIIEKASFSNISKLYDYVNKKIDEFIPHELIANLRSKSNTRSKKFIYEKKKKNILNQILILGMNDNITTFDDNDEIHNLIYFCGSSFKYSNESFLLPFRFYSDLVKKLRDSVYVNVAESEFRTGINVLLPKSQETYQLFKRSIVEQQLKSDLDVLDMGCGSGVISYILNDLIENSTISFTDILPESIASALLNLEKAKKSTNKLIAINPGSLYDNIDKTFDLIVFNPPWIDARSSNRSELALNDKDQSTVKEFLSGSKDHLNPNGKILLGFSDNSGDKAVELFEKNIADNSYEILNIFSDKIQSYQSGRKWMKIFVYELQYKL
ncbi:MAG: class I SAM-dependent methyltransferase, partial [Candidatus Delongbacteria bacterium]|nr:class I SAM-dependent methyltransferase [Candidatus Delongbacteria bacterium]